MIERLRPLGLACLCFLAGLLVSLRTAPSPLPPLLAALACCFAALARARSTRPAGSRAPLPDHLLLLAFVACGATLGAWGAANARYDCRARLPDGARVVGEGVLAAAALPAPRDPLQRPPPLPLVRARWRAGDAARCAADLRVRLPDALPPAAAGSRVRFAGEWLRSAPPVAASAWPQDPAYRGFVQADRAVVVAGPAPGATPLLWLRGRAETAVWRLFPHQAALVDALVLGRRERLDPELRERFARSGLVHLLAISGSHVGLFAAMVLTLGAAARVARERLVPLCIAAVALYLAVIGAPASAVRSGVMLSLVLLSLRLQRPAALAPVVAAAALPILAWLPTEVLDPGFQLSFAGVLGIACLAGPARRAAAARWGPSPALRWVGDPLLVSAAAFAATAPIVAHHFGQVAPVAVLANLAAVPLTALALAGIVAALALEPLAAPLARLVAAGAEAALWALDRVAAAAAAVPLGHWGVARPHWTLWALAGAAGLLGASLAPRLRPGVRWGVAMGCAAAVLLAGPRAAGGGRAELQVHFLDVGQGDATAIRTPAGRWILVDAGPRSRHHDAGQRRVLPFLRAHGAHRLEVLVLTHPDADHVGGAASVLRGIPVGRVVDPGLPAPTAVYREALGEIDARGIRWQAARTGRSLHLDGLALELLWPDPETLDGSPEANHISAVVRLRYGAFVLLLPGDAPAEVERRLVERDPEGLRAQVLKAGHHGSGTSTSALLLAAVRPELVVVSAGRRNRYGHPAPEVLRRLREHGTRIARTDRDGTVTIRAGADGRWSRDER